MFGPTLLAEFLTIPGPPDKKFGNTWQYHPRSDRHSKVACWGVALDLLCNSDLMRQHVAQDKIVLGVNHTMEDWVHNRKKDLDLVVGKPGSAPTTSRSTFKSLAAKYGIPLSPGAAGVLASLPDVRIHDIAPSSVLVALEAKATMTEHVKSKPRLYDELNSSQLTVHGASSTAIAVGYYQVNLSDEFASPTRTENARVGASASPHMTLHRQPQNTQSIVEKVRQLPRRSGPVGDGFDAVGITVVKLRNDGSPVTIETSAPAPQPADSDYYDSMIDRIVLEYSNRFSHI